MPALKPVKLGIIGCGDVVEQKHLRVLSDLRAIEVVALADIDPDCLQRAGARYGIVRLYPDIGRLLADPDIEAVGVCVPAKHHADVALAVMDAGKHVLIEKPLALSLDDADRLIARAAGLPLKAMVAFHMRWHRLVRRALLLIQQGLSGRIHSVRAVWSRAPVPRDSDGWMMRREDGGGVLVEIAVHQFDLWRFLLASEVEEVFAFSRSDRYDDESATVAARMANGVLVSAAFSIRGSHQIEVEVLGDAGNLRVCCNRFDGLEFFPLRCSLAERIRLRLAGQMRFFTELPQRIRNTRESDYLASYRAEWAHFAEAIRTGGAVGATLEDGRRALQVVLAVVESATTGKPVTVRRAPSAIAASTAP